MDFKYSFCFAFLWTVIVAQVIPFNDGWFLSSSSKTSSSSSKAPTPINLPRTAVDLSFRNWNFHSWDSSWHYTKTFDRPEAPTDSRFFFVFEGILTSASLTLNGSPLGQQIGGYVPFVYEATSLLQMKDNSLDVFVDGAYEQDVPPDRYPSTDANQTDFYQPGGIYRDVKMLVVPPVFISDLFVKPIEVLDPQKRSIAVECTVDVPKATPRVNVSLQLDLIDSDDELISTLTVTATLQSSGTVNGTMNENLSSIDLWSLESPKLYHLNATLSIDDSRVHDYSVRFGFREAQFTKTGFFLNGKRIQIFGLNRHQFFPFVGGAMPDRVQAWDAKILKGAVNMVRQSHYPQSPAFLDACDELGLLVWIEAPGWGYLGPSQQWHDLVLRDVSAMIRRDRNHPSVVVYGVRLNETPDNRTMWTQTQQLSKSLDDSRQTTGAMVGWLHDTTDFQQDVFSYNDYSQKGEEPSLRAPRKDWPYLVSESVGAVSGGYHYYRRWDTVEAQQNQATSHAIVHNLAVSNPAYCGVICWCGFDYPSGSGYTDQAEKTIGVFDLFRIPKLGASLYHSQMSPVPVIEPSFYWTFDGQFSVSRLGKDAFVWANADILKLSIDGKAFATLNPTTRDNYKLLKRPPFIADFSSVNNKSKHELQVDSYDSSGKLLKSRLFSSDSSLDRFTMAADDLQLNADGSDATRIAFQVVDKYANLRPSIVGMVQFQVVGTAGMLIGDNPFPIGQTGGAGAVWIRSAGLGMTGQVVIVGTHNLLGNASVSIQFT